MIMMVFAGGCSGRHVVAPEISLVERFETVAFDPHPFYDDRLWRWGWPIRVAIVGSHAYHEDVANQVMQLGEITGLPVEMNSTQPTMTVEFGRQDGRFNCYFRLTGSSGAYRADVFIATNQPARHIRRCIAQELSQAMGLLADTDGRHDTAFSSRVGTDFLTEADLALFSILYDRRLMASMTRAEAMPIVRQIVAEMEAEQEAGR